MSLYDKLKAQPIINYKIHTFPAGTTTFAVTGSGDVEYLVIAGGAGGGGGKNGNSAGAGGGAGGFRTNVSGATSGGGSSAESTYGVTAQNYTITVGAKGSGGAGGYGTGAGGYVGDNGSNSSIVPTSGTSIISIGGGGGAGANGTGGTIQPAGVGGSGGGAGGYSDGTYTPPYGVGTANQGYNGGNSNTSGNEITGGGGGSGAVGQTPTGSIGGNGGNGTASNISGSSVTYAGGGGGSVYQGGYGTGSGSGGTGGGGAGAYGSGWIAGANATVYGSGGGGANNPTGWSGTAQAGGNGSDGIVIIRYKTNSGITATGGTITNVSTGGLSNQRVVENFSGSALDSDRWEYRNVVGSGTGAMADSVDDGYEIKPSSGGADQSQIDFNGIKQYSPTGCAMISVAKSSSVSANHHVLGLINNHLLNISSAQTDSIIIDTSAGNFRALSGDNGTWSSAGTVISNDTNFHVFKVEASSSNILYYADGLLRITKTTNRPTLKLQPRFVARYASSTLSVRYAEVYNT